MGCRRLRPRLWRGGLAAAGLAAVLGCVPSDVAAVDPRETAVHAPTMVEVPARRAVARLDPVLRGAVRGTVFLRETPTAVAVEILVAGVEPGLYRAVVRDGADCARPAAAAIWGFRPRSGAR